MNKHGFTLVELLAVIIVIGLIASFALPQILNQFSNQTGELSEQQKDLVLESAYSYILENEGKFKGKTGCITLDELQNADALDKSFAKQVKESIDLQNDIGYSYLNGNLTVKFGC